MFYSVNSSTISVNCQVQPNTDVSGIGVRVTLYATGAIMLVLSCLQLDPLELLLSNLSIQATSLALILATIFDPTVDVPHTIIASMFSVLFSACRITPYDLKLSRVGLKTMSQVWIADCFFRTFLIGFNLTVWLGIRMIQRDNSVCSNGFGKWTLFWNRVDLKDDTLASKIAFAYCILDIVWEGFRFLAGFIRFYVEEHDGFLALKNHIAIDPRFWVFQELVKVMRRIVTLPFNIHGQVSNDIDREALLSQ